MNAENKTSFRKKVKNTDKKVRWLITIGGYTIIVNIVAIMLFLLYQSLPLSLGATIEKWFSVPSSNNAAKVLVTGIDPYLEVFYEIDAQGDVRYYSTVSKKKIGENKIALNGAEQFLSGAKGSLQKEIFTLGSDSGRIVTGLITMAATYSSQGRSISPSLEIIEDWQVPATNDSIPNHIEKISLSQNEDESRVWAWQDHSGDVQLRIYDADMDEEYNYNLSSDLKGENVTALTLSANAENLVVAGQTGRVYWFDLSDFEDITLKDEFQATSLVSSINYLLGDQAIVLGGTDGSVSTWFPVRTPANLFKFRKVHTFTAHAFPVINIFVSGRNRNFLTIDKKGNAKLHYSTTGQTQIEFRPADFPILSGTFAPKSNAIIVIDAQNKFGLFKLENPHPETDLTSLFTPVWYEGYPDAEFVWQSTGGSDEFEPKLSLIPLIFGTFKGTLFAMIFSIPLALLAAIYVSRFAPPNLARQIKPTVEIMAALPSVVIGFLAGLYFSPFFEKYLMVIILFVLVLPLIFLSIMYLLQRIPDNWKSKLPPGVEILFSIPIGLITLLIAIVFAPAFEKLFFEGNFQQWLYHVLHITYETRNSLVVGFALGFAVIPIIFTVSEDALTNVPESLTSASLALGASPWQTVRRVVLPAASGGIFAAIMLGLGRAVGETMIVLMATGNTPILDLNPFNGFRAMSACIAVEIPEAPVGGTLYRVLFLTGLLLFIFTFILNTLSSLVGDRLRKKYARF